MKTPVLESQFNKVADIEASNFVKKNSNTGVFLWILQNKDTYFEKISERLLLYVVILFRSSRLEMFNKKCVL